MWGYNDASMHLPCHDDHLTYHLAVDSSMMIISGGWVREKSDRRIPARASEKENASNKPLVFWSFADDNNDDDVDGVCTYNGDSSVVKRCCQTKSTMCK